MMLEKVDLSQKLKKKDYEDSKDAFEIKLGILQREARELGIPIILIIDGWDAAGKGTLINELILPLDPRGFEVYSALPPTEEERLRPFLWRFWTHTPADGRITIYDRSWYRQVLNDRIDRKASKGQMQQAYDDILSFERQLAEEGTAILKFFLHISKREQKKRMDKLRANRTTAWRVTAEDRKRHRQYDRYVNAMEDMFARTDSATAPWTIVEAHDRRFATIKVFQTLVATLEQRIRDERRRRKKPASRPQRKARIQRSASVSPILKNIDTSLTIEKADYKKQLKKKQKRLRELEHLIYMERIPVVIAYEGWDAAGKGGNLKRLTQHLDPRGYEVVPVAAPDTTEKAHHHLWRFWNRMPKAGHITIFDRTWYGRVLVERVEGFCSEDAWRRAYRQINEMERHMTNFGTVLLKFWIHIDRKEQLRRFKEREKIPHKKWKITDEDWRNREKWDQYEMAVDEMLLRTSTPQAPWIIVESNSKQYARIKAITAVIDAIEHKLNS